MIRFQNRINFFQVIVGAVILLLGTLVYVVDRPPQHTYFIQHFFPTVSLYGHVSNLFGFWGRILPDGTHVSAFILITAGLFAAGRTVNRWITMIWLLLELFFEAGQYSPDRIAALLPRGLLNLSFIHHLIHYFHTGTFDWLDICAIFAGTLSAYWILECTSRTGLHSQVFRSPRSHIHPSQIRRAVPPCKHDPCAVLPISYVGRYPTAT